MSPKASLSEQLGKLRQTRYAQVPRVRFVMQSFLASSMHSEANRMGARTSVLDWARNKWPGYVPVHAYEGKAFEHDQAGLRIAATSNADGTLWAFRSEHLDRVESRTWVTEAVVADLGPTDALGVRNLCSTLSGEPVPASSPRFLRDFVAHHALTDAGFHVTSTPHFVTDDDAFERCVSLMLSAERLLPMVVLSQLPVRTDYAIDPAKLAQLVQGLAHVFCLPLAITFRLSERVGKPLSVFQGAIRTYYPGFSTNSDPWHHHLIFAQRIAEWTDEGGTGAPAFEQFLSRQLHLCSVATPEKVDQLPSYFNIRRALLDRPNKTAGEEMELLRLELGETRAKEQEWKALAEDRDSDARFNEEENRRLQAQNTFLAGDLRRLREVRGEAVVRIPDNYDELPAWITAHYADRLVLHGRALRSIKEAVFENVELVYRSLRLLADAYWEMRTNQDPDRHLALKDKWDSGLKAIGVDYEARSLGETRLGEFREDYTLDWKIGQKTKQVLGPHLKYGNRKEDRYCMRIYFFWDDERHLVVIGHLPSHLDTRAT